MTKEKECSKCKIIKNKLDFYKRKNSNDGLNKRCRKCCISDINKYKKTEKGLITKMFSSIKSNSKKRGHDVPKYDKNQLTNWLYKNNYKEMFYNWEKLGFETKDKPSIDRINDKIGYEISNIRLVTFQENLNNPRVMKQKPVACYKNNKLIEIYNSGQCASIKTGVAAQHISGCCTGRIKTAGGFNWKFV